MKPFALRASCIVTALGAGQAATMAALRTAESALVPCRFETVDLPTYIGEVAGLEEYRIEGELAEFDCRNNRLAAMALAQDGFGEAVAAARARHGAGRIGVFLGTSTSGILETEIAYRAREGGSLRPAFPYAQTHNTFSVGDFVRRHFGLDGTAVVISAACASTSKAFGNAARMIESGLCDAAIIGGADSLCLTTMYGFHSLLLTSPQPCRPFDESRDGISIGEGAGFVLLERADDGDEICLLGIGESSDAHHMSTPHPEGLGARLAMKRALHSAGLAAGEIDYVNLHGTATRVGDAAEDLAVSGLFGPATPCSSIKGYTGHTLGASGIVEAIVSALCLSEGYMPGTVGTSALDIQLRSGLLLQGTNASLSRVMSNSFGFGGSNCSIVLGRA